MKQSLKDRLVGVLSAFDGALLSPDQAGAVAALREIISALDQRAKVPFKTPTEQECIEHGGEIDLHPVECRKFWCYWETRGWMMGKQSMVSWKAAMRTWKYNHEEAQRRLRTFSPGRPGVVTQPGLNLKARLADEEDQAIAKILRES